jgi:hypothetical protein
VVKHFPLVDSELRKEMVMKVVKAIAAGADGIEGTDDDLFSHSTLAKLKVMLDCDIINNVTETLTEGKSKNEEHVGGDVAPGKLATLAEEAPVAVEQVAVAVMSAASGALDTAKTILETKDVKGIKDAVASAEAAKKVAFFKKLFQSTCCAAPKASE